MRVGAVRRTVVSVGAIGFARLLGLGPRAGLGPRTGLGLSVRCVAARSVGRFVF